MLDERITLKTTDELADWYDKRYREMGQTWHTPDSAWDAHLNLIGIPRTSFDRTRLLLDIGCGDGSFVHYVSQFLPAQGMEVSRQALEYGRQKYDALAGNIYYGSAENTFGASLFDYITCMGSLEHIIAIDRALDNIRLALKPFGILYVFAPNETYVHVDQCNDRRGTEEAWGELFGRHGMRVVRSERMHDSTGFVVIKI